MIKHIGTWIGLYSGLLGIILGWILLQAANWYQAKKENNRIRRRVLFNLLDIYHLLKATNLDVESSLKAIFSEISMQFPDVPNNETESNKFLEIFSPSFQKILKDRFEQGFQELEQNYKDSINQLSPVDPIISFSLSGQTNNIKQVSKAVTTMIEGIMPLLADPTIVNKDSVLVNQLLEKRVFNQMMSDIKTDILDLSLRINIFLRYRVYRLVKKMSDKKYDDANFKATLSSLLTDFQKHFDTKNKRL